MDFFSKIGNKVTNVASTASAKVKDLADTTSINRQIAADETKINSIFAEIGKIYYTKHKDNPSDEFAASFNEIAALYEKIEASKIQLQLLKKTKTCTGCGSEIPQGVAYCSNCGAKAPEDPVAPAQPSAKTCPACGKVIDSHSVVFCSGCGCKLN